MFPETYEARKIFLFSAPEREFKWREKGKHVAIPGSQRMQVTAVLSMKRSSLYSLLSGDEDAFSNGSIICSWPSEKPIISLQFLIWQKKIWIKILLARVGISSILIERVKRWRRSLVHTFVDGPRKIGFRVGSPDERKRIQFRKIEVSHLYEYT